jgi:hypothetical protein
MHAHLLLLLLLCCSICLCLIHSMQRCKRRRGSTSSRG